MSDYLRVPNVSARLSALTLLVLVIAAPSIGYQQGAQAGPNGIEAIFEDGALLQDHNGDGLIDYVDGRIVLGDNPSDRVVAAAANVVARLGFETTAMNLPITSGTEGMILAVGQNALTELDIDGDRLGVDLDHCLQIVGLHHAHLWPRQYRFFGHHKPPGMVVDCCA